MRIEKYVFYHFAKPFQPISPRYACGAGDDVLQNERKQNGR
ncbi:MAG: hypothetical protein NWR22_02300 [Saprospiraceae bacterium]|nr:hypothetical protein [Saprospiraceae bacterium]